MHDSRAVFPLAPLLRSAEEYASLSAHGYSSMVNPDLYQGTQALVAALAAEAGASDPHRHHDIPVLVVIPFAGAELAGRLGVFEFQAHFAGAGGLQEIQQVLGVESDGHAVAVVIGLQRIFRFASLGRRGRQLQLALFHPHADGAGTLVGELSYTLNGGSQVFTIDRDRLVVVFG